MMAGVFLLFPSALAAEELAETEREGVSKIAPIYPQERPHVRVTRIIVRDKKNGDVVRLIVEDMDKVIQRGSKSVWLYAPIMPKQRPDKSVRGVKKPPAILVPRPVMRVFTEVPAVRSLLFLELASGVIAIRMREDIAPYTVERVRRLVRGGHYDGVAFSWVVDGFMAQGDAPDQAALFPAELSHTPYLRGTVGMMREADKLDSARGGFFITLAPAPFFNGRYTVWGEVVRGMEFLSSIKRGEARTGIVKNAATKIQRAYLGEDLAQDELANIIQPLPAMGGY